MVVTIYYLFSIEPVSRQLIMTRFICTMDTVIDSLVKSRCTVNIRINLVEESYSDKLT